MIGKTTLIKTLENNAGETRDIVFKYFTKKSVKNILIGGGIMLAGLIYTAITCFHDGGKTFDMAEYDAMRELGIIDDDSTDRKRYTEIW